MCSIKLVWVGVLGLTTLASAWAGKAVGDGSGPDITKEGLAEGKELFTREWLPLDKRSFAGNGLGPVHNARSCVSCHYQGAVGGAGSSGSNSTIVSAFVTLDLPVRTMAGIPVENDPNPKIPYKQPDRSKLAAIHPALRNEGSFIWHRFGNDQGLETWKTKLTKNAEPSFFRPGAVKLDDVYVALIESQRNPPALFGAALIESIPQQALEAVAAEQAKSGGSARETPEHLGTDDSRQFVCFRPDKMPIPIAGRVLRLRDGRVGRFGLKSLVPTLREFTLIACATEIGLEVPGFHRSAPPWIKDYKAPGLDLSEGQCESLIQFVASLPRPLVRTPETPQHAREAAAGRKLFTTIGCANCHRPNLGDVDDIYSDLLLHDMGQSLSGAGGYDTTIDVPPKAGEETSLPVNGNFPASKKKEVIPKFGAGAREWRTPPLWGLRDSAPYLHDGRADTIADAIVQHDGEGLLAARSFARLMPAERLQIQQFLESLVAPVATR
jgi:CxxC motif-containing protein (DUF1111 family)